jgi:hypothetical protein
MTLPGAGVGVEMVRLATGLGSDGESHAVVSAAAMVMAMSERRVRAVITLM